MLGDSVLQVQASHSLGQACFASGDFIRAAELLRRTVEAMDRECGPFSTDLRFRSLAWLTLTLSTLGEFVAGLRFGQEALRLAALAGRGSAPSSPTPTSVTCTSPKGTWSPPSGCWSRGWPSVMPPATGTGCT